MVLRLLRAVHKACWLLVKQYAETSVPAKPMHRRENPSQIEALNKRQKV
jgi:hypothetical protein